MEQIIIINANIVVCYTNQRIYFFYRRFRILGGRRYEDDHRKSTDDDYPRRDRDRYNNPSRRDNDTGRSAKYNHHDRGK